MGFPCGRTHDKFAFKAGYPAYPNLSPANNRNTFVPRTDGTG
jgi:hypothetical protein